MKPNFLKRKLLLTFLLASCAVGLMAQTAGKRSAWEKSNWKEFVRYDFKFEGLQAHVVLPDNPLDGNPWVWRARFPNWHTEMDEILLAEGFHVAHVNTANLFGSPKAIAIWDRFYQFLLEEFSLNKKVALEGVSRGGLFVYNWAKKNSGKVNCIYAEAPVCDIKSWPAGLGNGAGATKQWEDLKKAYGFKSDEEAKSWNDNPIDNLKALAAKKVPILHMIGLKDQIVPVQENTFVLTERYIKLGGIATVIPCTEGKQNLEGHHFPIETPRIGADFIKYYTKIPKQNLNSSAYHHLRGGIRNSFIKFEQEKRGRVAFLGGSITYGGGWRDSICNYLASRFPDTEFDFIAAGIGSMGTTPAAFRLERDVLKNGPVDLLFEEAAVNDAANGRTTEEQIRAMEGIVRHIRKINPACDVLIMHFVDPPKMETYRNGQIPDVIQNHEKVAAHYNISSINLAKEVTERIDVGEFTWEDDFKNLHPSPFGQGVYYNSMKVFLEKAWQGFVADDDKIVAYELPKTLNGGNYEFGELLSVEKYGKQKGWDYIENWVPNDGKGTRANYSNVPMLVNKGVRKVLKINFEGTAAGIAIAAGPDAGIIECSIDGGPWKKYDLFTRWSSSQHLPWYKTLAAGLGNGKHTVKIRVSEEKNQASKGNACRIRYIYVNGQIKK